MACEGLTVGMVVQVRMPLWERGCAEWQIRLPAGKYVSRGLMSMSRRRRTQKLRQPAQLSRTQPSRAKQPRNKHSRGQRSSRESQQSGAGLQQTMNAPASKVCSVCVRLSFSWPAPSSIDMTWWRHVLDLMSTVQGLSQQRWHQLMARRKRRPRWMLDPAALSLLSPVHTVTEDGRHMCGFHDAAPEVSSQVQTMVAKARRALTSAVGLQALAQVQGQQHSDLPGMPTSLASDSWPPPMPADFGTGSPDGPLQGLLSLPPCEAPPVCSGAPQRQPDGDQLRLTDPAVPAALDLGSLLGPVGDSWMGPLAFSTPAEAAPAAATSGTQVVATQKPFHMLFPIMN